MATRRASIHRPVTYSPTWLLEAGEAAFFQRYQAHKIRNVLAYLPDTQQHWFKYKLRLAYAQADAVDARQALYRLQE